jgi:acetyl esterase/lipase
MTPLALAATAASAQTPAPVVPGDTRQLAWPEPVGTIDLWSTDLKAPANLKEVVEEVSTNPADHLRRVQGISKPRLAVFPAAKPNGGAMLIIPGGGFSWNYFDHEGYELAARLNAEGLTCFVLFYRLANDGWADRADVGTIDALRAMRVIRANAARFSWLHIITTRA